METIAQESAWGQVPAQASPQPTRPTRDINSQRDTNQLYTKSRNKSIGKSIETGVSDGSLSFADVTARVDLRDVVSSILGPGKRAGGAVMYCSPFRSEAHPSFAVYTDGWHDFKTGEHGDAIDFIRRYFNYTFPEAVAFLSGQPINTTINTKIGSPLHGRKGQDEPPAIEWQKVMADEAKRASDYLWSERADARQVLNILRTSRGLHDDTLRRFQIGYVPTWRKTMYTDPETGKPVCLPPGIVIPVRSDGALWALHIRCRVGSLAEALGIPPDTDQDGNPLGKYRYAKGSKPIGAVFNGDAVQPGRAVLIVEGEFDAMLAGQQLGDQTAVITLGSASNRLPVRWRERLQDAGRIYSMLDADNAGEQATKALSELLGHQHQAIHLPAGKDITDYVVEHSGHTAALLIQGKALFPNGISDAVLSAARKYLTPSSSLVLHMINECLRRGLMEPRFTLAQLQEASAEFGFTPSTQTMRDTLVFFSDGLLTRKSVPESLGSLDTDFRVNSVTNTDKGRKPDVYELLPVEEMLANLKERAAKRIWEKHNPDEGENKTFMRYTKKYLEAHGAADLEQEINQKLQPAHRKQGHRERLALEQALEEYRELERSLQDPTVTPLPVCTIKNAAQFLALRTRTYVEQHPGENTSREEFADRLGCSKSMLDSTFARAGVAKEEDFTEVEITSPRDVDQVGYEHGGFPDLVTVKGQDGRIIKRPYVKDSGDTRQFIGQQLKAGAKVTVRLQIANKHHIVTESPPLSIPTRPSSPKIGLTTKRPATWKPYFGPGYDPEWEMGQVRLGLSLLGWELREDGHMVNLETGDIQDTPASPCGFIEWLIGREIPESWVGFTQLGAELGAVMSIAAARAMCPPGDGWREVPPRRLM
jgi:DNA primase